MHRRRQAASWFAKKNAVRHPGIFLREFLAGLPFLPRMPSMPKTFAGLWPALVTPMTAAGSPNLESVQLLVERFVAEGLNGLYVTGSTGQWPLLSVAERKAILEATVEAAAGRLTIMAHVGAMTTPEAVELAKHAAKAGADAISTVAPIYYGYSSDVVFQHYHEIGAAGELPLYVYHFEPAHKLGIGIQDYAQRLLAIPNIAGLKMTSFDLNLIGLLHKATADRLKLFSGADELMAHAILSGVVGAIGTFYNVWGTACRKVWFAAKERPSMQTQRFMLQFQAAIAEVLGSGSTWSFLEAAVRLKHGVEIGRPRAPLGMCDKAWNDEDVMKLLKAVDAAAE